MAIAFDSYIKYTRWDITSNSLTGAVTVANNTNRVLVVGITSTNSTGAPSSVTYNGVSMTKQVDTGLIPGTNLGSYIYTLVNPDTGTHNVVVTQNDSDRISFGALSLYNVKQTGTVDATASNTVNPGTSLTVTITTVANNAWIISAGLNTDGTNSITGTAGVVARDALPAGNSNVAGDTNGPVTPAGAKTVIYNGTTGISIALLSLTPEPAGPPINIDTTGSLLQGVKIV